MTEISKKESTSTNYINYGNLIESSQKNKKNVEYFLHHYKIIKKIGHGSYGDVYKGSYKEDIFAIKVENMIKKSKLSYEFDIYYILKELELPIPKVFYYGTVENNLPPKKSKKILKYETKTEKNSQDKHSSCIKDILVMEYLGPSLESLFIKNNNKFKINTIAGIGIQILRILEKVHNAGILHRDIKPHNFLIGKTDRDSRKVYIIDFGISKKFMKQYKHIKYMEGKSYCGSLRYCSLRNHIGVEPSRRDDLESVGFMLLRFFKKTLPWQGISHKIKDNKEKSEIIKLKKLKTSVEELCEDCLLEFKFYIEYCRSLDFREKPNYNYLIGLFNNILIRNGVTLDTLVYDWE